jgi:hypothetical protein
MRYPSRPALLSISLLSSLVSSQKGFKNIYVVKKRANLIKWGLCNMTTREKFTVSGDQLLAKVKQLVSEGNVRKVRIKNKNRTILEVPLTVGAPAVAIGILMAPVLAAIGALAALVTESTIEVERVDKTEKTSQEDGK